MLGYLSLTSKHLLYGWYYKDLKKKYADNGTLLCIDTDSLFVDIKTETWQKETTNIASLTTPKTTRSTTKQSKTSSVKWKMNVLANP